MRRLRRRILISGLFAAVVVVAAALPLIAWRAEVRSRITRDLEREAEQQMADVLAARTIDEEPVGLLAWEVSLGPEEWTYAFSDTDIELPLLKWMREAEGWPTFRSFTLEFEGSFLAFIRPVSDDRGFVTVVDRTEHDRQIASLNRWSLGMGAAVVLSSVAIGWLVSGWALGRAERTARAQRDFLADAAHEMRTPLAVIQASSSQALARPRSSEEYVRALSEIRSAAERASAGVNELLDLARFESGQLIPRVAPLRLDLLTEEIAASVRHDDGTISAVPGDPVVVDADMSLLRQALDNLVRNATRRARNVELATYVDGRDGVVEVRDDGPGFEPATVAHVLDRFRRSDRSGHAGMGLAIVKAIATAHGGSVAASNRSGGGAVVTLRIPLARSAAGG